LDGRVRSAGFTELPSSLQALVSDPYYQASHLLEVFGLLDMPDIPEMLALL